jgi:hypothetical protein
MPADLPQPRHDLSRHPYFQPWTDPDSGVTSYLLDERVAPVQQSFYFTNPSVSADGEWLWFFCAFPPGGSRSLGVVRLDPDRPLIKHFPGAQFSGRFNLSPMVAPAGEPPGAYICIGPSVWAFAVDEDPYPVCTLDPDFVGERRLTRLATTLSVSSDGHYFLLDGEIGEHWFIALGDRHTGEVRILEEFLRPFDFAQFSPMDPELFLFSEEWWHHPESGQRFPYHHRTWLMDTAQTMFQPLLVDGWSGHGASPAHQFWSSDGKVCWVDLNEGAFWADVEDMMGHSAWERPIAHAHCHGARRFWCGDESPYKWDRQPCQVLFYDAQTDREVEIVSAMPQPPEYPAQHLFRSGHQYLPSYHVHPHPQFSPDGAYVIYTTTVKDRVDVALVETAAL